MPFSATPEEPGMILELFYWKTGDSMRATSLVDDPNDGFDIWQALKESGWHCFVYKLGTITGRCPEPCHFCVADYEMWQSLDESLPNPLIGPAVGGSQSQATNGRGFVLADGPVESVGPEALVFALETLFARPAGPPKGAVPCTVTSNQGVTHTFWTDPSLPKISGLFWLEPVTEPVPRSDTPGT
jgi:hypothetical protein